MIEPSMATAISDYGPFGIVMAYMWIQQKRQKEAILCLARNTNGVDSEQVRRSFRVKVGD
jgi:hypothetical protein